MRYWVQLATEQFPPSELVEQAVEAEQAGFDGLNVSDHFQPWWEPGHSGQAWALLARSGRRPSAIAVGTGVTAPVHRYHPAVVAQFGATLQELFPGRGFLGIGSGESLNESPAGMDWPDTGEQVRRMEEALDIIDRLLDGERVDHEGRFFRTKAAYLHTRGSERPPLYVSAFGPDAAGVAARFGDGLWTLADPESAPDLIEIYKRSARRPARSPARSSSRPASPGPATTTRRSRGRACGRPRSRRSTSPTTGTTRGRCTRRPSARLRTRSSSSPTSSARTRSCMSSVIREIERLGATIVCLQNGSGAIRWALCAPTASESSPPSRARAVSGYATKRRQFGLGHRFEGQMPPEQVPQQSWGTRNGRLGRDRPPADLASVKH